MIPLAVGFAASFLGSVPAAGPVGVLIVARGFRGDPRGGMSLAIGAAVAESIYAVLAYAGLGALFNSYPSIVPAAHLMTAFVLVPLGLSILLTRYSAAEPAAPSRGGALLGFTISAFNPAFVATWTLVAALSHSLNPGTVTVTGTVLFAAGVGLGAVSGAWVLMLAVRRVRRALDQRHLRNVAGAVGIILIALGVIEAGRAIF